MVTLREMREDEIVIACHLIGDAMNMDEAKWAEKTMNFHFGCKRHKLDDGRRYYIGSDEKGATLLAGLHHYEWGPPENVWLSWLAVRPDMQRKGIGRTLVDFVEKMAREMGFTKIFIETYSHPDFQKARMFYEACSFEEAGKIDGYLPTNHDMVVYKKTLGCA